MRIVTRPDFDGIVCAALLYEAEKIEHSTLWIQPSDIQKGLIPIKPYDIIANLPYHKECALWFDHHVTNQPDGAFQGSFSIAPSAARVIFEYYTDRFHCNYESLIRQTDDIDSANLTIEQIRQPERYPHVLLSMTILGNDLKEIPYWEHLTSLLRRFPVESVVADPEVAVRCREAVERNSVFKTHLLNNTRLQEHVAITDFRSMQPAPDGNRFLVYALYPEASVSVKIRFADPLSENLIVSVGRSILKDGCNVNIGKLLTRFGGGGHAGAGACKFSAADGDRYIPEIINTLEENKRMGK